MSKVDRAKDVLRRCLPPWAILVLKSAYVSLELIAAFGYDFVRYRRYSSSVIGTSNRHNLQAMITERYHSLEKGMSLPSPRPAFGARPVADVLKLAELYVSKFGSDDFIKTVAAVLTAYLAFNQNVTSDEGEIPHVERIRAFLETVGPLDVEAGTRVIRRAEVVAATEAVTLDFFKTRNTVRQFSGCGITREEIEFAAHAARQAPAVCNRQFGRVYVYQDVDSIRQVLEVQGGARGFAGEISGLAVVTANLRSYWNDTQRNQAWVDGGLFAMSFIFGLHAQGIGSVCLNWSKTPRVDQEMRSLTGIPQDEAIIMLVGFGRLKEEYRVASSPRRPIDSLLVVDPPLFQGI